MNPYCSSVLEYKSLASIRNDRLNEFRKLGKFTDLVLVSSDNKTMTVHKNILCASCPYFDAMFDCNLIESQRNKIEFKTDNLIMSDLEFIIEFIYIGIAKVPTYNALNIYIHADFFQLEQLKNFCEDILISNVSLKNCLDYWRNAKLYSIVDLEEQCLRHISDNSAKFLNKYIFYLTSEELTIIIATDISIGQDQLFTFIMKWLKKDTDIESRDIYLNILIKNYNFTKLSDSYIKDVLMTDELLLNNKDFLTRIVESNFSKLEILQSDKMSSSETCNCINKNIEIPCIKLISNYGIFNLNWNRWKWKKQYRFEGKIPVNFSTATLYNQIYISGGTDSLTDETVSSFQLWNTESNKITKLTDMIENRHGHQLVDFKGQMYACAGRTNNGSVEIYDLHKMAWFAGPQMCENKYDLDVVRYHNSLYSFGGSILNSYNEDTHSKCVEQLDPREGNWRVIATEVPKFSTTVCRFDQSQAYCFNVIDHGMLFDFRMNQFTDTYVAYPLYKKRRLNYHPYCNTAVELLYREMFGVFLTDNSSTWGMFKYDLQNNQWHDLNIIFKGKSYGDINLAVVNE